MWYPRAAVGIALLAFALRLINLGGQSLWYDEAYQVRLAALPLPQLLERVSSDTNQPLSFVLLHLWGVAGPAPDFFLRFPSALAGCLAVPLVWATGRVLLPAPAALAGALALAIAPFAVFYSQETRMYSELLALTALAGFGFALGWQRDRTAGWALFALVAIAALYTHLLGALPCLAPAAWALLQARSHRQRVARLLVALVVVGVAAAPGAAAAADQAATVLTTFWAPSPHPLTPLLSLYQVLAGPFAGPALMAAGLALVLLTLALTLPAVLRREQYAQALGLLWAWAVLPVAGLLVLSVLRPVYLDRVLIGVSVPLCLLLGWAFTSLRPRVVGATLGMGLGALALWGLGNWYLNPAHAKPSYRQAAQLVASAAALHEPVLHTSDGSLLPFLVYAPAHRNLLLAGDPEQGAPTSRAHSTQVTLRMRPQALEPAVFQQATFWLVVSLDHSLDYQREAAQAIDARYRRTADHTLGGVVVRRYDRRDR